MTAGPRIAFVRFLTSDSPKITPWVTHAGRVVAADSSAVAGGSKPSEGIIVWQLVSANNRQLARGIDIHESFEAAFANVSTIVAAGDSLVVNLVSEAGRGMYGWYASLDDKPVVACARWYVTDRDRRHSIDLAMRSIPVATLHSGSRLTDPALMAGDRAPLR